VISRSTAPKLLVSFLAIVCIAWLAPANLLQLQMLAGHEPDTWLIEAAKRVSVDDVSRRTVFRGLLLKGITDEAGEMLLAYPELAIAMPPALHNALVVASIDAGHVYTAELLAPTSWYAKIRTADALQKPYDAAILWPDITSLRTNPEWLRARTRERIDMMVRQGYWTPDSGSLMSSVLDWVPDESHLDAMIAQPGTGVPPLWFSDVRDGRLRGDFTRWHWGAYLGSHGDAAAFYSGYDANESGRLRIGNMWVIDRKEDIEPHGDVLSPPVVLKAGARYKFRLAYKTSTIGRPGAYLGFQEYQSVPTYVLVDKFLPDTAGRWMSWESNFVAPDASNELRVILRMSGTGTVWFDTPVIEELQQEKP
jgi:hypothetical protein